MSIPFMGGLDTKTDEKLVAAGSLTDVSDGIYTKNGTINKRNGYDALSASIVGGGSISSINKSPTFQDELLAINNTNLYSYSSNSSAWVNKGSVYNVETTSQLRSSSQSPEGASRPEIALNGNVKVTAWADGLHIYASVSDITTNTEYQSSVLLYTYTVSTNENALRAVTIGNGIFVFFYDTAGGALLYRKLTIASPLTFGVTTTLVAADVQTSVPSLDVITYGANGAVSFYKVSTSSVRTLKINDSGTILLTHDQLGVVAPYLITSCTDGTNIYVTYGITAASVYYHVLDATFTTILTPTVIGAQPSGDYKRIATIIESANTMRVFLDKVNTYVGPASPLGDFQLLTATATVVGVVSAITSVKRQLSIASKPFLYNSNTYLLARTNSTLQSTYYLIDVSGNIYAKSSLNQAQGATSTREMVPNVINLSTGNYTFARDIKVAISQVFLTRNNITEINFNFVTTKCQNSVECNNNLLITGGYVSMYDGASVAEFGFNTFPENVSLDFSVVGSGLAAGTYTYYVVYQWVDSKGNTHRSSPSTGTSVTLPGGGPYQVDVYLPTLRLTAKQNVSIVVYRTQANSTVAYKLPYNANTFGGTQNPVINNTGVEYLVLNDVSADPINSGEILYTTGGVLENIVPPSCTEIEVFKNRVILSGLEDNKTFWFSKQVVYGEGIGFSDSFVTRVDQFGEGINGCKTMDDKLLVFKDNIIFVIMGDGPLDTGEQDNFTFPQLISTDVGCPYPDSFVLMPMGIMFKSNKGIYLIDRTFRVSYLGSPVETYNSQTVKAATLVENFNQVRFLTNSGRTLLYDYFFNKWNTFLNHTGNDSSIWNGVYVYARTNGVIYKENTTSFTDNGIAIVLHPTTPWIKLNSLEGYQRVRRAALLGNYFSPHTLTIKVYYDYNDNVFDTYTFNTATGLVGPDNVYQFRMHLKRQKCESIKFEFDDSVVITPGQGYSINDLAVEIGLKRGLDKLPAIKSVG